MTGMHLQILLYDNFDPLDVIGPFEVLAAADASLELVSIPGLRPVVSGTRNLVLTATGPLDPDRPGYVVVPGVSGPLEEIPQRLARFDGAAQLAGALANPDVTVATGCGGALALALAGLITGRHAVTHVQWMPALEATGVHAVPARVVDDGDLISSGGVTSGLDLGLYLVEREFGPDAALGIESLFQYERRGIVWKNSSAQ